MKIAYIEDDQSDATLLKKHISYVDFLTFKTFKDYIESRINFDMIISDFNIPDGSMTTLKTAVQKEQVPFIIYTGGALDLIGQENIEYYKKIGIEGFYEKGKDDLELIKRIAKHDEKT